MNRHPLLSERRNFRFSPSKIISFRHIFFPFFSGKAEVVNISPNGVAILCKKKLPKNLWFCLDDKNPFNRAHRIWEKKRNDQFVSGWQFSKTVNTNYAAASYSDRRNGARRNRAITPSVNSRKEQRRFEDFLTSFSPFSLKEPLTFRRKEHNRRLGQIKENFQKKIGKHKTDRRAVERRSTMAITKINHSALFRSVCNVLFAFRDLIVGISHPIMGTALLPKATFAFITHPRDISDVRRHYPFAAFIPKRVINWWLKHQWPVIGASIINENNGITQRGWLIFCPLTAKQMLKNRQNAAMEVKKAVLFAEKIGCKIVGLGAFTSIVTKDGLDLVEKVSAGITTGNALSAAAAVRNVVIACKILNKPLDKQTLAIVGAGGNVGSVCARNFIDKVKKLILIDINQRSLNSLQTELNNTEALVTSSHVSDIKEADIVITVTNTPGAIVNSVDLKSGAIVIDCAQPKNVSERVPQERDDVIVIESAILKFPRLECDFDLGIGKGEALGCMGETIVLDGIKWHKNFSVGKLSKHQTDQIMAAAERLGIDIAYFRHSQGFVNEIQLEKVKGIE